MNINTITHAWAVALTVFAGNAVAQTESLPGLQADTQQVQVQHIRNATIKVAYAGTTFLVDPMLAAKDTYPGFEGTYRSELRNPMIDLPMSVQAVIEGVDAVIVTHTHLDHWMMRHRICYRKIFRCLLKAKLMPA